MIKGTVVKIENLADTRKKKMFAIMKRYYENLKEDNFYSDLSKKQDVILLCDKQGDIHGFTTQAIFLTDNNTQLLFSGDTIVEQEYWGANDLWQAGAKNAFKYAGNFNGATYWFLLSKGYKTYKYLHTFFNEFYPQVDKATLEYIQEIMDKFCKEHYGEKYQNGVLKMGKDYLKEEFAVLDEVKLKNRHTAFFLEKNPNYKNGDELVCLCELSVENLNKLGRKMLGV